MNRAETILSELSQSLEGMVDEGTIHYLIEKGEGPAFANEQEASGADRAQRVIGLMADDLKSQVPALKMIQPAILRICTSPTFPLLMRESVTINEGIISIAGQDPAKFMVIPDDNSQVGDRIILSLVYWMKNKE